MRKLTWTEFMNLPQNMDDTATFNHAVDTMRELIKQKHTNSVAYIEARQTVVELDGEIAAWYIEHAAGYRSNGK